MATITTAAFLAMPAIAADPAEKDNNTWISVSGTVKSVSPDTFILEYDKGTIPVEMDDWDNDADAYKVVTGDKVTVNGIIDDDLFERKSIEASSVYVEGFQKIKKGDRVSVSGMFDTDLFEARKFDATSIVTLSKAD